MLTKYKLTLKVSAFLLITFFAGENIIDFIVKNFEVISWVNLNHKVLEFLNVDFSLLALICTIASIVLLSELSVELIEVVCSDIYPFLIKPKKDIEPLSANNKNTTFIHSSQKEDNNDA